MDKLDEVINEQTGETRLQNIKNAVSLLRLCKDPPDISVPPDVMSEILSLADAWLEARKWKPTLHFCQDWDFLVIDKNDPEFAACGCYPKEKQCN